jgi:hypothetical protein
LKCDKSLEFCQWCQWVILSTLLNYLNNASIEAFVDVFKNKLNHILRDAIAGPWRLEKIMPMTTNDLGQEGRSAPLRVEHMIQPEFFALVVKLTLHSFRCK